MNLNSNDFSSSSFNTFLKKLENISPFCGFTDTPVFELLVMAALGLKARVDPLACMLCHLNTTESFGATPADLSVAIMVAQSSLYILANKLWWGSSPGSSFCIL